MNDAEILRSLREKLGLSIVDLADAINTPAPLLEVWEAGTTKPRAGVWRALCELLALRGVVTIESEAEAADRRRENREQLRAAEIASLAATLRKSSKELHIARGGKKGTP